MQLLWRGALIIVVLLVSGLQGSAQDVGSGGIGGRPAYPQSGNLRSESIFVHTIDTGSSASDGIKVINNSTEDKTILVYATDSVRSSGGAFACAQQVDRLVDVGSWVTLDKAEVVLKPLSSEVVDFTISVPDTADAGEHNGCIVVQEAIAASEVESGSGIGLNFRTALRVAVLVPGALDRNDLAKQLEIVDFSADVQSEHIVLTPRIENQGVVSVDTEITTRIESAFGGALTEAGGEFPVLRTETGEWNFTHDRPFWGGLYRATVQASYDENPDNFLGEGEPSVRVISHPSIWIFVMPSIGALLIELLATGLGFGSIILLLLARRRRKQAAKDWIDHTLKKSTSLQAIAKSRDVHWKTIAKVNKLKPPYHLEAGQTVRIPPKKKK